MVYNPVGSLLGEFRVHPNHHTFWYSQGDVFSFEPSLRVADPDDTRLVVKKLMDSSAADAPHPGYFLNAVVLLKGFHWTLCKDGIFIGSIRKYVKSRLG
jgi:hypothetical protein